MVSKDLVSKMRGRWFLLYSKELDPMTNSMGIFSAQRTYVITLNCLEKNRINLQSAIRTCLSRQSVKKASRI